MCALHGYLLLKCSFTIYRTLAIAILLIGHIQTIKGQHKEKALLTIDNATTGMSPSLGAQLQQPSPKMLRICSSDDPLSNAFCKCETDVISCDFSNYSSSFTDITEQSNRSLSNKISSSFPTELELNLYEYQATPTTSRFCICNAPSHINLLFTKEHFLPFSNRVQRYDLYNLRGVTKFLGGFSLNFHGDLYIANVSSIPDIGSYEFGSGAEYEPIEDLQNLKCCSPIEVNQQQKKPIMFIENTTIGRIHPMGISDSHLWRTLIIKSINIREVQRFGILFDSYPGYNVAIMGSRFDNVASSGLVFKDASNLFMLKNYFKSSTSSQSWLSRSNLNDSNVLLMDNIFWNRIYMDVDAQNIVSQFNIFDVWDNYTFSSMKYTRFPFHEAYQNQRTLSFKFNLVNTQLGRLDNLLNFGKSKVTFSSNVIGTCNCSFFNFRDELIKPEVNYCFTGSIALDRNVKEKCSVKLIRAMEECNRNNEDISIFDFNQLCKFEQATVPGFPGPDSTPEDDNDESGIKLDFILLIARDFQSYFDLSKTKIDQIILTEEMDPIPANLTNKTEEQVNNQSKESQPKIGAMNLILSKLLALIYQLILSF